MDNKVKVFSKKLNGYIPISQALNSPGIVFSQGTDHIFLYDWVNGGWTNSKDDNSSWLNGGWTNSKDNSSWMNNGWVNSKDSGAWTNSGWTNSKDDSSSWMNGGWTNSK